MNRLPTTQLRLGSESFHMENLCVPIEIGLVKGYYDLRTDSEQKSWLFFVHSMAQ